MSIIAMILGWVCVLVLGALLGKLVSKLRLPAILGWLLAGMIFGPYGLRLMSQSLMDRQFYIVITNWMQVAFGLMLGTELVWRKIRKFGKALMTTTLTQSLGTFAVVSAAFMIIFRMEGVPVFLGLIMGSIALATAPAPALSIVREFHTQGPVTDTLRQPTSFPAPHPHRRSSRRCCSSLLRKASFQALYAARSCERSMEKRAFCSACSPG